MHTLAIDEREWNAAGAADVCVCVPSSCFYTVGSHYRSIDWYESEIGLVVLLFVHTLSGILITSSPSSILFASRSVCRTRNGQTSRLVVPVVGEN